MGPASREVLSSGTIAWSPDGTTIACIRDGGVQVIDLAIGEVRALAPAEGIAATSLSWSPAS